MKALLLCLCLLAAATSQGQDTDALSLLFKQKKYTAAIAACDSILRRDSTSALAYDMLGRCHNALQQYSTAIPYFEKAIALDSNATYLTGWAYCDMGRARLQMGDTTRARADLCQTVQLGHTRHSVNTALSLLHQIAHGADPAGQADLATTPAWIVVEHPHIRYYFEDTIGISYLVQWFITAHDQAYDTLERYFQAQLTQPLSFYVWLHEERAQRLLHCPALGFAEPERYTVHTRINQTVGHEMTHVLSYWAWGQVPASRSRFINEGVAVAFDLAREDKVAKARRVLASRPVHSVLDIWQQGDTASGDLVYPVGGAFLQYLYRTGPPDHFHALLKDQTIPAAQKIYGPKEFDTLIHQFDTLLGLP